MSADLEVMAIVGIRSGSKSMPGKNIRPLAGKPLVHWILDAAAKSEVVNRLIVSTDCPKYAAIASEVNRCEVPFLRPERLASDEASDYSFVRHALDWLLANEGYRPDVVVRLLATCPLQSHRDFELAIQQLKNNSDLSSCVVVAEARQHPMKAMKLVEKAGQKTLAPYLDGVGLEPLARQKYPTAYFRANVVASRLKTIYETKTLTGPNVGFVEIPQNRAVDIDTEVDFQLAETILRAQ